MPGDQMDIKALEVAVRAEAKIDSHERECAMRYGELERQFAAIHKAMWAAACSLILLLMSILGFMMQHQFFK